MFSVTNCSIQETANQPPKSQRFGSDEFPSPYVSTDDDLPDIFWPGGKVTEPKPLDAISQAQVAVSHHYSAIEKENSERRNQRSIAFENRSALAEVRGKQYIKFEKKEQMHASLEALAGPNAPDRMSGYEQRFFADMHSRFAAYFPSVKWVTRRQFEFLQSLAVKYLALPNCEAA